MDRVLWPLIVMATRSGTPARTMFRNRRPSEIMEDAPDVPGLVVAFFAGVALDLLVAAVTYKLSQARRNTSRRPSLSEIPHRLTLLMEHIGGQKRSRFRLNLPLCLAALHQVREIAAQGHAAAFPVLSVLTAQPHHIAFHIRPAQ